MTQQLRDPGYNNPSSPHSSSGGGADSYQQDGTPTTNLTTFSPEDGSTRVSNDLGNNTTSTQSHLNLQLFHGHHAQRHNGSVSGTVTSSQDKDPFTTSQSETHLSPTALTFRPVGPVVVHGSLNHSIHTTQSGQQQPTTQTTHHPRSSETDKRYKIDTVPAYHKGQFSFEQGLSHYLGFFPRRLADVQVNHVESYLKHLAAHLKGNFEIVSADGKVYARFINIHDALFVNRNTDQGAVDWTVQYVTTPDFIQALFSPDTTLAGDASIPEGVVEIHATLRDNSFNQWIKNFVADLMDSQGDLLAIRQIRTLPPYHFSAIAEYADADEAIKVAKMFNGAALMDGGVNLVVISLPGTTARTATNLTTSPRTTMTSDAAKSAAPVGARSPAMQNMSNDFQNMAVSSPMPSQHLHLPSAGPFSRTPSGASDQNPLLQAQMQAQNQQSHQLQVYQSYHPPLYQQTPTRYVLDQTPTRGHGMIGPQSPLTPMNGGYPLMAPLYTQTPPVTPLNHHGGYHGGYHSEYASPRGMQMQACGRPDPYRRQNAMRVSRSPYHHGNGNNNHVDINHIREGRDVRTTIMLRNIPNKVDQAMLKRIIDESSYGKYDFMYLRIDFANDCNVGYAFINFVDPLDIIPFVQARGNQRWNCFKSDKVAEISYATIQGKDCLVQKFRNSSVMLEPPHYRPKLFYTSNGPRPELAGQEEEFPGPDNQSKMKRSCENAEHVGLFTPNAGQHLHDEQRRRRSQFDRGTRLAALEEYDYENHHPQQQRRDQNGYYQE